MLGWERYGFNKKHFGTSYHKLVFLHPVGSAGHVVHSDASGREMSMHYFSCSGGAGTDCRKSAMGHVVLNISFCI
jgi:hypothetical protein